MLENIFSLQQGILSETEKREAQIGIALSSLVNFSGISCKNSNNEYKYKEKTISKILADEKVYLENLKSGNKEHNYEFDKPVNPNKPDLEYLPKQILHTEFIVNKLNLGDLILMDSSFMHENDVEFEQLEMNNGIRIYIFGDKKSKSLYVVSEGTVSGEFSILSDMMFSSDSEKDTTTTNQKEKKDNLIGINSKNKDKKITIENKNEYELRKYAISEQNIIFNSIASKLLESYMDIKDNFENELQNMYFIGHSSGRNKVMNLFANQILNSHEPDKELDRCKCICINSIGWAKETKNYFENKFQEKNIDFKKFAERVIDIKGSADMISVINEHPIGKTVFIESNGHYTEDISIGQFIDLPDTKYYLWAQFFVYIKNYLSTIKNSVTRDEKIITILKAFDYRRNKKQTNVFGEDITTYRTKIFIIDMWILFKCYIKAWIVVYVFRIKPPIEKMNSDSENKIATTPIKNKNHFIVYKNIDQIKVPFSDNTPTIIDTPMHIV